MDRLVMRNVMRLVVVSSMLAISVNIYMVFGNGVTLM
jgi:hypothetical protein